MMTQIVQRFYVTSHHIAATEAAWSCCSGRRGQSIYCYRSEHHMLLLIYIYQLITMRPKRSQRTLLQVVSSYYTLVSLLLYIIRSFLSLTWIVYKRTNVALYRSTLLDADSDADGWKAPLLYRRQSCGDRSILCRPAIVQCLLVYTHFSSIQCSFFFLQQHSIYDGGRDRWEQQGELLTSSDLFSLEPVKRANQERHLDAYIVQFPTQYTPIKQTI